MTLSNTASGTAYRRLAAAVRTAAIATPGRHGDPRSRHIARQERRTLQEKGEKPASGSSYFLILAVVAVDISLVEGLLDSQDFTRLQRDRLIVPLAGFRAPGFLQHKRGILDR